MKNIILIGMPGAGKSTVGVLLAKSTLRAFVDTDLLIQQREGKSLCEIIEKEGIDRFLEIENEVISAACFDCCVVATGGSAVYGNEAMQKLRLDGTVVYLKLPVCEIKKRISDIHSRGVAVKGGVTLDELYAERKPLYEKYADVTVDCGRLSAEQCVERIIEMLSGRL
ncbi:MAG: shikimate kinase [Acutalibacteraceae bacterium]